MANYMAIPVMDSGYWISETALDLELELLFSGRFALFSLQPCLMVFDQRLHVGVGILFCNIHGPCVIFFAEFDHFNLFIQKLLDLGEELFLIFTTKRKRNALMDSPSCSAHSVDIVLRLFW